MIRKAEQKDIPSLNKLLSQVLTIHANGRPDIFKANTKKYTDEELSALLQNQNTPIFVAVNENERVHGYAFCVFVEIKDNNILHDIKYLYIDDLCVDETCRGQKIGKELYDYVCTFAKENGCKQIRLNVWNLNNDAIRFYEKCGLTPLKTTLETNL